MGLLGKLLSGNRNHAASSGFANQRTGASSPMRVKVSPNQTGETICIEGDSGYGNVYVYDGRPLKNVRKGSAFYLDVVPYDLVIESKETGTVCDTAEWGNLPLAYDGYVVGAISYATEELKEAMASGLSIRLKVRRDGTYMPGIPELTALLPQQSAVKGWWNHRKLSGRDVPFDKDSIEKFEELAQIAKDHARLEKAFGMKLPSGCPFVTLFVEDKVWRGPTENTSLSVVKIETELVPTPKGSSAKPHIAVYCNGVLAADVSARSTRYAALLEHVGEAPLVASAQSFGNDGGEQLWKLTIVYSPKL